VSAVQAVFGVLSAIEGCNAFSDLVTRTDISRWYFAVKSAIAVNAGERHSTDTQLHMAAWMLLNWACNVDSEIHPYCQSPSCGVWCAGSVEQLVLCSHSNAEQSSSRTARTWPRIIRSGIKVAFVRVMAVVPCNLFGAMYKCTCVLALLFHYLTVCGFFHVVYASSFLNVSDQMSSLKNYQNTYMFLVSYSFWQTIYRQLKRVWCCGTSCICINLHNL